MRWLRYYFGKGERNEDIKEIRRRKEVSWVDVDTVKGRRSDGVEREWRG